MGRPFVSQNRFILQKHRWSVKERFRLQGPIHKMLLKLTDK